MKEASLLGENTDLWQDTDNLIKFDYGANAPNTCGLELKTSEKIKNDCRNWLQMRYHLFSIKKKIIPVHVS